MKTENPFIKIAENQLLYIKRGEEISGVKSCTLHKRFLKYIVSGEYDTALNITRIPVRILGKVFDSGNLTEYIKVKDIYGNIEEVHHSDIVQI